MNTLDIQYQKLLQDILDTGITKKDRTGTGTISVFGRQVRHKMSDGFPILTTKKVHFKSVIAELLWFLRGETNIKSLLTYGCNIWNGDAYKNYSSKVEAWEPHLDEEMFIKRIKTDDEFAKKWGELGPIYGKQWRSWGGIDQIQNLISELKTNPDSRRLIVSAWNIGELDQMVLPPCHFSFQCYSHEKDGKRYLSLAWNQRSVDTFLGLPFNIASYGLLLEIIAKAVNMIPDELIGNLGDVHLYNNHIEQAKEQISRTPYELPTLNIFESAIGKEISILDNLHIWSPTCFIIENYQSHSTIKAPLSN